VRLEKNLFLVIPAQAGIQTFLNKTGFPPEFIPIYIGAGMADQRIIDGFSHASM